MDRSEIMQKVTDVIVDTLDVDADAITEETSLSEDLDADSLDGLELVTAFEDEFGISIEDDKLPDLDTIGSIIDAIESAQ